MKTSYTIQTTSSGVTSSRSGPQKEDGTPVKEPEFGPISVSKKDVFFIALAKKKGYFPDDWHNFNLLGCIHENQPIFLARIGKTCKSFCCDSKLQSEPLRISGYYSYSAHEIHYEHFIQFLRLVSLVRKSHKIFCYQPVQKELDDTNSVEMHYSALSFFKREKEHRSTLSEQAILQHTQFLNLNNTCRHTAVNLVEYTQNIPPGTSHISTAFFSNLSVCGHFFNGVPQQYFYIFPLPPDYYEKEDVNKKARLTQILQRMEDLLTKDPYGENTIAKFEALKKLYHEQARIPNHDMVAALASIQQWKESNRTILSQLRAQSLWGKAANFFGFSTLSTQAMAEEMEEKLLQLTTPG